MKFGKYLKKKIKVQNLKKKYLIKLKDREDIKNQKTKKISKKIKEKRKKIRKRY